MADNDQSINNLRYNQVSGELEGFGGGSPQWTPLTLTNVDPTQVPVTRQINTTAPLTGGGDLSTNRTLSIPVATGVANGYLSSTDWTTFNGKLSSALSSADIFVGNGSNVATGVPLSGDATLSNAGALTLATVNGDVGSFTSANITVDAKGRITAAASGSSSVPDPLQLSNGSSSAPTYSFASHTGAGLWINVNDLSLYGFSDGGGTGGDLILSAGEGSTANGRLRITANNSGNAAPGAFVAIEVQSEEQLRIDEFKAWSIRGDAGLPGQVIASQGSSLPPVWAAGAPTVSVSAATVGGAATESVTVNALLTTSTIWSVSQVTPGANNLPLLGWMNVLNGSLTLIYSADPGAGAQVVVTFIP